MLWNEFVKKVGEFEGFSPTPYKCPAGVWTIGFGRTAGVSENTPATTLKEEEEWLDATLHEIRQKIVSVCFEHRFNENQLMALASFAFNCGFGNFEKLIGGRTNAQVSDAILLYNKAAGKVLNGLVKRRKWEKDLFDEPVLNGTVNAVLGVKLRGVWYKFTGICRNNAPYTLIDYININNVDLDTAEGAKFDCAMFAEIGNSSNVILIEENSVAGLPVQFFGV